MWPLACPDWEDRIRRGRSLIPKLPLDKTEAERAVAIWNKLRLPDVLDRPPLSEAGGEWFRDIVRALFGSVDSATGERMIREIFALVCKKNAKTTAGAALMMTALLMNKRPRAEFLFVGPTKLVSELAFGQALGMVEADPDGFLQKRMHVQEHLKRITDRRTKARLEIKTFDTGVLTGVKPVGVLIDELHEIASDANADRVIGQLRGGLLPNPEGFLVFITTQSERPPAGVFKAELTKAREIRDGRLTGVPMLPVLYEFPRDIMRETVAGEPAPWMDSSLWRMVNPNHGRSMTVERLIPDFEAAKAAGEAEVRRWASQHLNIEIGLALRSDRWVGADFWQGCAEPKLTLDQLIARSEVIVIGGDGGGLDDLLGIAVLGREPETRNWLLWTHAWAHPSALERRKSEAARYRDFEKDGDLTIVNEIGEDTEAFADIVDKCEASGKLDRIGVDAAGIADIVDAIVARGFAFERIVAIPQGWKLVGAIKTAERRLAEGAMKHAGSRMMNWCVGNAKVEPRGNAVIITKQAAGTGKIDPLMATFDCVALMAMNPASRVSVYESAKVFV